MTPSHDEALALARESVPFWVPWLPVALALLWAPVAWLLARGLVRVAIARVPREGEAHWTQRALAARALRGNLIRVAMLLGIAAAAWVVAGPLSPLSWAILATLAPVAAVVGWSRGIRPLRAALGLPEAPRAGGLRTAIAYSLLFFPHLLLVGLVLGVTWGREPAIVLGATAIGLIAIILLLRGGALRLARALGAVQAGPPRLLDVVRRASERSERTPPEVVVVPSGTVNAFAFVYAGVLGVTSALVDHFDDTELEAIVLHELGHLAESPAALRTRALSLTAFTTLALLELEGRVSLWIPLVHVIAVIVVARWVRTRAHALEQAADAHAHDHAEEGTYARALEKVYRLNLMPAVLGRGRVHPDLYDRMLAAGVTPDYPRPPAPVQRRWLAALILTPIASLIVIGGFAVRSVPWPYPLGLALGDASALYDAARARADAGHPEEAIAFDVLYDEAYARRYAAPIAALATDQTTAGRCEDARASLDELARRSPTASDAYVVSPAELEAYWASTCEPFAR